MDSYVHCRYDWESSEYAPVAALTPEQVEEFYINASHSLHDSIQKCYVRMQDHDCSDLFKVVKTDGGKAVFQTQADESNELRKRSSLLSSALNAGVDVCNTVASNVTC